MKCVILGGSGFIGSHIVDAFLTEGWTTRVFDRHPEQFRAPPDRIEFVPGDFSDTAVLAEALTDVDLVVHCISTTMPSTANMNPVADIQGNLIQTVKLLELMRAQDIKRLIFLSSGGTIYGPPQILPVPEHHTVAPISSYGIVKAAIERFILMEERIHGLRATIFRPSNPFGPRQGHRGVQGVVGTYMWRLARGEKMQLWGDGSVVRDFLHVSDLARACALCARQDAQGVFNVGAGEGRSIMEIIEGIARVSGQTVDPERKPGRLIDVPRVVLDISAIRESLGWEPQISFEEGLEQTWNWVGQQIGEADIRR